MIQKTGSPLLQCLEKLNDDVWEQVLLPKLQEQGSAAAVALSCSQLRRLCQHSIDTLTLRNLTSSSTSAQQLACQATAAAAHFSNCRAVCMCAHDETSYWQLPVVLPLLSRLPKLDLVRLDLSNDNRPLPAAMLLGSMRMAVTGLQNLVLGVGTQQDWTAAPYCWEQLAEFTHLKSLTVECRRADKPFRCEHLSVLGKLSNLKDLTVHIPGSGAVPVLDVPDYAPQVYSWLGSLSALTRLGLSIPTVSGVSSIGGCTNLCDVFLSGTAQEPQLQLGDAEWDALGQLTRLTALDVFNGFHTAAVPDACTAALSRLGALVALGGPLWTEDTLQVFSQLPHLDHIRGCWGTGQPGGAAPPRVLDPVCARVTHLEVLGGSVPFRGFPNLLKLSLWGDTTLLTLEALADLTRCCPKLQEVWVAHGSLQAVHPHFTLDDTPPLPQRIATIKSLSRLEDLSVLGWKPSMDAELAAVVDAVQSLAKLKHLAVVVESGSRASCVGLVHLARLAQLERVEVVWNNETLLPDVAGATCLFSVLCRVPCVIVLVAGPRSEVRMLEAQRSCDGQGLPLPQQLEIRRLDVL